jgi:hypothetical protein
MGQCKFCGSNAELREGGCWECANAEAIIDEGLDMYDKGIDGKENNPAISSGQKLKLLIDRGWIHLTNLQRSEIKK